MNWVNSKKLNFHMALHGKAMHVWDKDLTVFKTVLTCPYAEIGSFLFDINCHIKYVVCTCPNAIIGSFLLYINYHIKYVGCIFNQPTCIPLCNFCLCFFKDTSSLRPIFFEFCYECAHQHSFDLLALCHKAALVQH